MPELAQRVLAKLERERQARDRDSAATDAAARTPSVAVATTIAAAYRRYWALPETELLETFRLAYAEIARLERETDPEIAWHTLRESATGYHTETGVCPFCRERGDLHLPAEQRELELMEGRP